MKSASTTRCGFVALVGLPNAGKSTLLNALVQMPLAAVTPKPQTTQRLLRGIDTQDDCQIIWVDSPGLLRPRNTLHATMQRQIQQAIRHADVLVHVVDVTRSPSESGAADVLPMEGFDDKPVVLVCNKIDRLSPCHPFAKPEGQRDKPDERPSCHPDERSEEGSPRVPPGRGDPLPVLGYHSGQTQDVPPTPSARKVQASKLTQWGKSPLGVSAVTGEGVEELRTAVTQLLPRGPFLFDPQEVTDAPERALVGEFIRREAMLRLRQELPYCIAVTVERFDERRRCDPRKPLVEIEAVLHVERPSQRPMVVGRGGECVKAIGVAARTVLQRLLDCQVMLRLCVRVQPHWRAHAPSLRKLGYDG